MASLKSLRDLDVLTQPSSVLGGPTAAAVAATNGGKTADAAAAAAPAVESRVSSRSDLESLVGSSRANPRTPSEDQLKEPAWKFWQNRAQESKV